MNNPLLSILICTVPWRKESFNKLVKSLQDQRDEIGHDPDRGMNYVEILSICDNGKLSVGKKRQILLEKSIGKFIVYIDDDDTVAEDYTEQIIYLVSHSTDNIACVGINGVCERVKIDGGNVTLDKQEFRSHSDYKEWEFSKEDNFFHRPISHINPVLREIAIKAGFQDVSWEEDKIYSYLMQPYLTSIIETKGNLYFYKPSNDAARLDNKNGNKGSNLLDFFKNFIVVGVASDHENTVKWYENLRKVYSGKVILYLTFSDESYEYPSDEIKNSLNLEIVHKEVDENFWANKAGGLNQQWKFIKECCDNNPNSFILRTDVWDVIFQKNPAISIAEQILKLKDCNPFFAAVEPYTNEECDKMLGWYRCSNRISEFNFIGSLKMINSGVVAANAKLLSKISEAIINREYNTWNDQSELNVILKLKPNIENMKFVDFSKEFLCLSGNEVQSNGSVILCGNSAIGNYMPSVVHANGDTKETIKSILAFPENRASSLA